MTADPSDKVAKLTSAQGLALMVLVEAGADGARGSRGMSEVSKAPWMSDLVNTRSVTKLIDLGLAKEWQALPDGSVVTGANLVRWIGMYHSRYGITAAGRIAWAVRQAIEAQP